MKETDPPPLETTPADPPLPPNVPPALLENVLTVTPAGLAILSGDRLTYRFANRAYCALLPYPELDPVGIPFDQVWSPEEARQAKILFRRCLKTGRPILVQRYVRRYPDGADHPFAFHVQPLEGLGEPSVLVFQWDITSLEQAQRQAEAAAQRSALLARLSNAFAEAGLEVQTVIDVVARRLAEIFEDLCVLILYSPQGEPTHLTYHHPDPTTLENLRRQFVSVPSPITRDPEERVFHLDLPALLSPLDPAEVTPRVPPAFHPWLETYAGGSLMVVLLMAHGRAAGALGLLRAPSRPPYITDDLECLRDIAGSAALAIENARLYAAETQRASEMNALHTATAALLSTLDLEPLLRHIVAVVVGAIPAAQRGALHLIARRDGRLQVRAQHGFPPDRPRSAVASRTYAVRAIDEARPILILNTRLDPARPPGAEAPARSVIAAPLLLDDRPIGALTLEAPAPHSFTSADLRLLASFATATARAISNARRHSDVQQQAITDPLTGLYNRRGFFSLARREMDRARRFNRPLCVMMLDIDHFKAVNDAFTHPIGDQVLRGLSARLRLHLREIDLLGRLGGEEFALLLPETSLDPGLVVAERLRQVVAAEPFLTDRGPLAITISIGLAPTSADIQALDALLAQADAALYQAKQKGRNRVEVTLIPLA